MKQMMISAISAPTRISLALTTLVGSAVLATAGLPVESRIAGRYLEVRSCDVYTGYCFANSEMGLAGKEGMLVWAIERGGWNGVDLAGLNVIAVVQTHQTLGNVEYQPRQGRAVLITDDRATHAQREALVQFARSMAGSLVAEIADVKVATISASIGSCGKMGCATVSAPGLVEISSRCLSAEDHVCGNEETFYPPLTRLDHAMPAYSELAAYRGDSLGVKWEGTGQRNVFLGGFSR